MMRAYTAPEAEQAVQRAVAGNGTPADAEILADLFRRASGKRADRQAASRAEVLEREANALAAVLADVVHDAAVDDRDTSAIDICNRYIDDLPRDARRRVLAYRHRRSRYLFLRSADQFGPLPDVPARDSVMRDRVRTIDVEPAPDEPTAPARAAIEAVVVDVRDTVL